MTGFDDLTLKTPCIISWIYCCYFDIYEQDEFHAQLRTIYHNFVACQMN